MKLENQHIIIVSNEPWGDVWYSKHNYANELSKKNTVIFINPTNKWKFSNLFSKIRIESVSPSLSVLHYHNILPSINFTLFRFNDYLITIRIKKKLKKLGFSNSIFWSFDPYRIVKPNRLTNSKKIFHIVDLYGYTHWGEQILIDQSDYCIFVSKEIIKNYAQNAKRKLLIPHAISSEEFTSNKKPEDIPNLTFGLYVGNIDHRIDFEHLEKILATFPNIPFVFIGKVNHVENPIFKRIFIEKNYQNTLFLGIKHFKELKHYIHEAGFCFAFMEKRKGNDIAHHKIFQYLAMGKPVFSSNFSDYNSVQELLYMENDAEKSKELLNYFLENGENDNLQNKRIDYAYQHTFDEALKKIENFINED